MPEGLKKYLSLSFLGYASGNAATLSCAIYPLCFASSSSSKVKLNVCGFKALKSGKTLSVQS